MSRHRYLLCLSMLLTAAVGGFSKATSPVARGADAAAEKAFSPEQIDFFEKKIRPLLVDRCIDCHAEDANGGLQLDSAAAVRRGAQAVWWSCRASRRKAGCCMPCGVRKG